MQRELTKDEKTLLEGSVKELIPKLAKDPNQKQVKECSFGYWSEETEEEFQVQVLVTRNEPDFLKAFETEYTR